MPPHTTGASNRQQQPLHQQQTPPFRDQHIPRRPSFRASLRESGLPDECLEALDSKRRQLDDSIWKYIASKEREYKQYEKELKHQRRQDGEKRRKGAAERDGGDAVEGRDNGDVDGVKSKASRAEDGETMNRSSMAGLKDRRASMDRDKDFEGVFTPNFLTALSNGEAKPAPLLDRISSTPDQLPSRSLDSLGMVPIKRTNSDSVVSTKKSSRPSQLALQHRTSSSGGSIDGRLASAMKSPTQQPKRKRVSLAVGDAIVAPSDNVPISLTNNSTPSHSRTRVAAPDRSVPASLPEPLPPAAMSATTSVAAALVQAEQTAVMNAGTYRENGSSTMELPLHIRGGTAQAPTSSASSSKIDPDGDLFDLDGEDDAELPPPILDSDDFDDSALENDTEIENEILARQARLPNSSEPINTPPATSLYESTAGMLPRLPQGPDNTVTLLGSSAVASQQPMKPGFRRPSVVRDPVFQSADYAFVEQAAVDEDVYGSGYSRSGKGSFQPGSLGGSYMERNAEEMMRLRGERQRSAQVRS